MRVAVTGASGFVGGWIAHRLEQAGHEVHAFGRRPESRLTIGLSRYIRWDLADGPRQKPVVDAVVHSAAYVSDWGSKTSFANANVEGTRTVLASFASAGRFVHLSTASVYAKSSNDIPISEDAALANDDPHPYVQSKIQAERLISHSKRPVVVLRPHIVYGPGDPTLLPRLLAARRLGILLVPGNGLNRTSLTHVFNLVHGLECVLDSSVQRGVFNIVDSEDATIDCLLRTILKRSGYPSRIFYLPMAIARPMAHVMESIAHLAGSFQAPVLTRYIVDQLTGDHRLDASRAHAELGYSPRWAFHDGPLN